jgi:pimeloyl-ACP methyl ester carboxylesterase
MQILAAMWEFPTFERFAQVRCPVLVIPTRPKLPVPDEQKPFLAAKQQGIERLEQINPSAQVQWFEDTIHDIPLQRPEQLAEIIQAFIHKHTS